MSAPWRIVLAVVLCCLATTLVSAELRPRTLERYAFIVPAKDIDVASAAGGVIDKVAFEEGAKVTAGQPLVYLKSDVQRAQYKVALARVDAVKAQIDYAVASEAQARADLARAQATPESVSEADLDSLKVKLELATAQVQVYRDTQRINQLSADAAKAVLDQMTVVAPMDGDILIIYKHEGEAIEEHAPLMRLVNVDNIHVKFALPFPDVEEVKPGMKGTFAFTTSDGAPERRIPCTVFLVDVAAQLGSDLFWCKARFDNSKFRLRPGIIGTFRIDLPQNPQDKP